MDLAEHPHQVLIDLLPEAFIAIDAATRCFAPSPAPSIRTASVSEPDRWRPTRISA